MDPKALANRIFDLIGEGDKEEIDNALDDALAWIRMGGFTPIILADAMNAASNIDAFENKFV